MKAGVFVKYDAMAYKLCEASIALTMYPPGTEGQVNSNMMSELLKTSKVNLTARGLSQVENFLADTDFSVSTSFSDLRSITKLYFGEKKNHFYKSADYKNNPDWDFESELANMPVHIISEDARRAEKQAESFWRRAGEWWEEKANWEEPQTDTCRLDLAGSAVDKTIKNISATSTMKKVKQILSGDNCTQGNDPDNHVYQILNDFLTPPEFAGRNSETSAEY